MPFQCDVRIFRSRAASEFARNCQSNCHQKCPQKILGRHRVRDNAESEGTRLPSRRATGWRIGERNVLEPRLDSFRLATIRELPQADSNRNAGFGSASPNPRQSSYMAGFHRQPESAYASSEVLKKNGEVLSQLVAFSSRTPSSVDRSADSPRAGRLS
jgi:hypothetical protein